MLALILAATIDAEALCAKYAPGAYTLPPAAAAAAEACDPESACYQELAEKYANGEGVQRDYAVAESFLCKADMAPAEFTGMLEHVQEMRSGTTTAPLDFCDYVSSGYSVTYCAHVQWERVMPQLEERVGQVRSHLAATTAFDRLRKRADAFVAADSKRNSEWSRGGTIHSADVLGSEVDAKRGSVEALERWSKDRAPAVTATDATAADAELNAAYRAAQKDIEVLDEETRPEFKKLLRDAQRAWIAYRDAFADYYAERWQGAAAPDSLRKEIVTQLSRDRAGDLREE